MRLTLKRSKEQQVHSPGIIFKNCSCKESVFVSIPPLGLHLAYTFGQKR